MTTLFSLFNPINLNSFTNGKEKRPTFSSFSWENRVKSSSVKPGSLTPLSTMILVTVESSEFQSMILKTVAFGLCFGRLGWLVRTPMSSDHTIHTTPSWIANVPVRIECVWKSHFSETGHVWSSLHWPRIHFQEWHDADSCIHCLNYYVMWDWWAWASLVNQVIFISLPRIINVVETPSSLNANAS